MSLAWAMRPSTADACGGWGAAARGGGGAGIARGGPRELCGGACRPLHPPHRAVGLASLGGCRCHDRAEATRWRRGRRRRRITVAAAAVREPERGVGWPFMGAGRRGCCFFLFVGVPLAGHDQWRAGGGGGRGLRAVDASSGGAAQAHLLRRPRALKPIQGRPADREGGGSTQPLGLLVHSLPPSPRRWVKRSPGGHVLQDRKANSGSFKRSTHTLSSLSLHTPASWGVHRQLETAPLST